MIELLNVRLKIEHHYLQTKIKLTSFFAFDWTNLKRLCFTLNIQNKFNNLYELLNVFNRFDII